VVAVVVVVVVVVVALGQAALRHRSICWANEDRQCTVTSYTLSIPCGRVVAAIAKSVQRLATDWDGPGIESR